MLILSLESMGNARSVGAGLYAGSVQSSVELKSELNVLGAKGDRGDLKGGSQNTNSAGRACADLLDEASIQWRTGLSDLLPEDRPTNPPDGSLVVLHRLFPEPEEDKEDKGRHGHNPEEEEELALVRRGVDEHRDRVDAPEVGVHVCPVRPRAQARGDVVVHRDGGEGRLPDDLKDRHGDKA